MTADPQKTYALVVGVEQYAAGSKWDLDGPANDASKFVEWLRGRGVPNENIYLYLSPLDKNTALARPGVKAATHENIYQALTTILPTKKEGTLLYLFWGGHGMIRPDNQRLLFYADATQQNILNLDLISLLTSLRSNFFSGFDQQIFFVDACANYVVNWQLYGTLPHDTFTTGDPLPKREQFVCLAARPGEYAKNISEQQTGLFSQVVQEELAKQGSDDRWPPDMKALITSLSARFSKLRAEGMARQTPTYFWYRNWDGSESAQGTVFGDYNNVYQQFISGITSLRTNYGTRIRNFLADYLDSPEQRVPFGGREADIERLDAWLDDPQATPYLLLAAPAGRGKSALLVRWSQSLMERPDLRVVFVPVSIRYTTNLSSVLFASLAARLAEVYEEPVPTDANNSVEIWKSIVSDYLDRTPGSGWSLVVIVDGIDEAADWQPRPDLFPVRPPKGLRVVLSARYIATTPDHASWLTQLGWDRPKLATAIDLDPLSEEGVADVLKHMDEPIKLLGDDVEFVRKLHDLSDGGDPLLIQLYAKDLNAQGNEILHKRSQALENRPPGLEGYFEKWWADQKRKWGSDAPLREANVQMLLNLLSCAWGPLSQQDIEELEPTLNSYALEVALTPLERFVISDGQRQGYVFSHSRLADHFRGRLSSQKKEAIITKYLRWGAQVLVELREGQLAPENVPPYLVQYYLAHLKKANAGPEALLPLVSDEWRRSWEEFEGTYAGFLNNVLTVWRLLEKFDGAQIHTKSLAPYIGCEVRCALVQASINSLVGNIPPRLIEVLVATHEWTAPQGIAYALQTGDRLRAAAGLIAVLPYVASSQKREYLNRALTLLQSNRSHYDKSHAYEALLPEVARLGYIEEALSAIDDIPYINVRLMTLVHIGQYINEPQRHEVFASLLWKIGSQITAAYTRQEQEELRWLAPLLAGLASHLAGTVAETAAERALAIAIESVYRGELIAKMAPYLPEHLLRKALAKSREIERLQDRAQALSAIAPHLQKPLREEAIAEACAIVMAASKTSFGENLPLYDAIVDITPRLPKEVLPDLFAAVTEIHNEYWAARILAGIAPILPEPLLLQALEHARQMTRNLARGTALAGLVPYLPSLLKDQTIQDMLAAAQATTDEYFCVECLKTVQHDLSDTVRSDVLAVVQAFSGEEAQAEGLTAILSPLIAGGRYTEAWDALQSVASPFARASGLIELLKVPALPSLMADLPLEGLKAVEAIASVQLCSEKLVALAPHLPESLRPAALHLACAFEDEITRRRALQELAPHLPEFLQMQLIACARRLHDDYLRALSLADLALYVTEDWRETLLKEALGIAQAMSNAEDAKRLCCDVAFTAARIGLLDQAKAWWHQFGDNSWIAYIYAAMVPHMDELMLLEALDMISEIEPSGGQSQLFVAVIERLPESMLTEAKRITKEVSFGSDRQFAINKLIERLIKCERFGEALEEVEKIDHHWGRIWSLEELAPHLSESQLRQALILVLSQNDALTLRKGLEDLAPHLGPDLLQRLLEAVRKIDDDKDYTRLNALTALLPSLTESTKGSVIEEITTALPMVTSPWIRQNLREALAPYLPGSRRYEAFREVLADRIVSASEDNDDHYGFEPLKDLAQYLPEHMLPEALSIVLSREHGWGDAALAALAMRHQRAPHRKGIARRGDAALAALAMRQAEVGHPEEAIATTGQVSSEQERIEALAAIVPRLPYEQKKQVLKDTLEDARDIGDLRNQIRATAKLIPYLPDQAKHDVLKELLGAARSIKFTPNKVEALGWLAVQLAEPLQSEALEDALSTAQSVPEGEAQSKLLKTLVEVMVEVGQYERALTVVSMIGDGLSRREALEKLASRLPQALLDQALEIARTSPYDKEEWRAAAIASFAVRYSEPKRSEIFREALKAAKDATLPSYVANMFRDIAAYLTEELLHEAIHFAQQWRITEHWKGELLARLAPHIPEPLLREELATVQSFARWEDQQNVLDAFIRRLAALGHIAEAMALTETLSNQSYEFANALAGMAPYLTGELVEKVLDMAQNIPDEWKQVVALRGLIACIPDRMQGNVLAIIREMKTDTNRVEGFAACVPYLKGRQQMETIEEFLREARDALEDYLMGILADDFGGIEDSIAIVAPHLPVSLLPRAFELVQLRKQESGQDFTGLSTRLTELPLADRYELWREILPILAAHSRPNLLDSVRFLGPIIAEFGGPVAIEQVVNAISETGRWWP